MQKEKILSLLRLIEQNGGLSESDLSLMLDAGRVRLGGAPAAGVAGAAQCLHAGDLEPFWGEKGRLSGRPVVGAGEYPGHQRHPGGDL